MFADIVGRKIQRKCAKALSVSNAYILVIVSGHFAQHFAYVDDNPRQGIDRVQSCEDGGNISLYNNVEKASELYSSMSLPSGHSVLIHGSVVFFRMVRYDCAPILSDLPIEISSIQENGERESTVITPCMCTSARCLVAPAQVTHRLIRRHVAVVPAVVGLMD